MIKQVSVTENAIRFNFTEVQSFCGFMEYWKLTVEFYAMMFQLWHGLTLWQKTVFGVTMVVKTLWWVAIKPMGQIFKVQKKYAGLVRVRKENGEVKSVNFSHTKKSVLCKALGIPVVFYQSDTFNDKDREMLSEQYVK